MPIKLMIADDHPALIDGVRSNLTGSGIELVGTAEIPEDVLPLFRQLRPDVLLCDVSFGSGVQNGFAVVSDILLEFPAAKLLLYTQYDQDEIIRLAYSKGCKGLLWKTCPVSQVIDAIKTAHLGGTFFPQEVAARMAAMLDISKTGDMLSPHERHLISLFGNGKTDESAAKTLKMNVRTVRAHKHELKERLGLKTQSDITKWCIRNGLIDLYED